MKRLFLHGTVCPLCLDREQNRFVWSDMLHSYICWLCSVELCVDFYPAPDNKSNYFQRVSEVLGFNEWICRRLYLQEVLMIRSSETGVDAELCKRQIEAVNEFLEIANASRENGEVQAAKIILLHKLRNRAFNCNFGEMCALDGP